MNKQDNELSRHKLITHDPADPFGYPPAEDIYSKFKEETSIDPEDISRTKAPNDDAMNNERDFDEDMSGGDLDIPESVSDENGKEDEENDIYSLGGENHHNLEEDKGN